MNEVLSLAAEIAPDAPLPAEWQSRVAQLPNAAAFLAQAARVLRAEIDQSYFQRKHFKQTVAEKQDLPYEQCCLLAELLGAVFPERLNFSEPSPLTGDGVLANVGAETVAIADEVVRDGVSILDQRLSNEVIWELKAELSQASFLNRTTKVTRQSISVDSPIEGAWWVQRPQDLGVTNVMQRLAFDPTLLAIAQAALGTMPIHVQTNAWWTFPTASDDPNSEAAQKRNAQWFHQDMEFIKFVKVFVYLSDVNTENGPHVYVRGSANDYEERLPGVAVSSRVSDDAIEAAFGADRVQAITGPAGTVAIVNTRGYHKGAPVVAGCRLLLQLEYASSLYFNPVPAFPLASLEPRSESLRQAYPRLFLNYREPALAPGAGLQSLVSRIASRVGRRPQRAA